MGQMAWIPRYARPWQRSASRRASRSADARLGFAQRYGQPGDLRFVNPVGPGARTGAVDGDLPDPTDGFGCPVD